MPFAWSAIRQRRPGDSQADQLLLSLHVSRKRANGGKGGLCLITGTKLVTLVTAF